MPLCICKWNPKLKALLLALVSEKGAFGKGLEQQKGLCERSGGEHLN